MIRPAVGKIIHVNAETCGGGDLDGDPWCPAVVTEHIESGRPAFNLYVFPCRRWSGGASMTLAHDENVIGPTGLGPRWRWPPKDILQLVGLG